MTLPGITEGVTQQGTFTPDNLIAGEFPRISRVVMVTGNAALPQGAVLGRIALDGRYRLSVSEQSDGSEVPDAILAENIEATAEGVQAHVFFTGEFNSLSLTMGVGHTLDSVKHAFRQRSLFLRTNQP